jgi:hypothetical protein
MGKGYDARVLCDSFPARHGLVRIMTHAEDRNNDSNNKASSPCPTRGFPSPPQQGGERSQKYAANHITMFAFFFNQNNIMIIFFGVNGNAIIGKTTTFNIHYERRQNCQLPPLPFWGSSGGDIIESAPT